ncbi:MAG TPA: MMPL family transporter, partial [Gaiellaceae bacterium]|nr:MMPL family transporter [Gaiellaceae bacterium]
MALWSAHHRKIAIFGWLAFVIVIFAISKVAITQQTIVFETAGPGESGRADAILYDDFKQPAGESILIQNPELKAGSPAFRAVVKSVIDGVAPLPAVAKVESPFDVEDNSGLISDDQHSVLVPVEIKGLADDASDKVDPIVDRVTALQKANPDFTIGSFGESTNKALFAAFMDDLLKAGAFSIPLTLITLLVAFGALVAAGIPLLLGLTAVLGTMGLVAIISQALPMSESVSAIILLIGLAVGVDYTMFYLKREREERAAGRSEEAALEAAAATSGRSVLISGFTVLVAMAGMLLTFDPGFASFGVATMTVVAVAMLGSLTVLPALLSKLGDNVDRLRVPFVHRLRRDDGEGRIWGAIIDRVLRRPALSVVLAGGLLVALAVPAYQLHTANPSIDTYPQKLLVTYNRLKDAFPGTDVAASVVVKAPNVEAPAVQEAIGQLKWRAIDSGVMNEPIDVDINAAKTVANINIPVEGDGTDS